ncbi:MAG TPA: dihydrolipoamide acetyltransferase family protein [Vicinamibacterales bacterium]|nr:dihydrolipoamide acetyltransferase family protein [Vicinamibacterales bacterium]
MPTPVTMPQMGESIAEGTIVRWIKKVGDTVDRDEPLFEISTDKVDAEIPSPAAGVLLQIKVNEGETVAVDSVVGLIGAAGETVAAGESVDAGPSAAAAPPAAAVRRPAPPAGPVPIPYPNATGGAARPGGTLDDLRRRKSSPVVRRIAHDHNINIDALSGSGIGGRVTKRDILGYIDRVETPALARPGAPGLRIPAYQPGENVEVKPLSVMRRKIAEHMVLSRRTSAHVHTVFHVDFTTVDGIRRQKKAEYEQAGARLTYMTFVARACCESLRAYPVLNAALDGDTIVYKKDINLGIAVALDGGLIVPVVKQADTLPPIDLSKTIADLAERARAKQLKPEEVQAGTFTITNPGQLGAQFGLPIINQPQVAILCVGAVEKRPVVVNDELVIRTMSYLTLGFDHRLIDGFAADEFMADLKRRIEHFDPAGL